MTERNRRVERQMQADYERLQPNPVVSEWMQGQRMDPELHKAVVAFESGDAQALDPFFAERRRAALASAQQGDMTELSELVRNGTTLNADEREFVANWLIGDVLKRRGAPQKSELSRRVTLAQFWLTEVGGDKGEAALSDLQKRFGMARSTVSKHLKAGHDCILTKEKIAGYRLLRKLEYFDVLNHFKAIDLKSE
jgi:hypothetical protein